MNGWDDGQPDRTGRLGLAAGLALFLALVGFSWVGLIASDDVTYAHGAYGWLQHFPYVGGHGTIRYFIAIPMALAFRLFGENEYAMALPSLLYALAFLVVAWRVTRDVAGAWPAFGALLALATSPLLVIQSSIANVDAIEMAFLFGSVVLTWRCLDAGKADARRLFLAGVLAGCAFLTRETAIFVAVFYALLFLAGHRLPRLSYFWVAAGFLAVWLVELAYLWAMTGDPFYRITIALHHDSTIDRGVDLAGNVIVHPLVDPLLVLLFNQEFMALFFLAVPLGGWLCFGRTIEPRLRHFARVIALFGLVWFVCAGAVQHLLPLNPRYFMITAAMACILTGVALARLIGRATGRGRLLALAAAALLVGGNMVGLLVENKEPVFGERALAALAARYPQQPIATDPMTRYRAAMLLHWERAEARVVARPPQPGMLYFYNPAWADRPNARMSAQEQPLYRPQPGWRPILREEPAPSLVARALETLGVAPHLPGGLWHKLRYRHPAVTLYRVPAGGAAAE